ncbi:class I SAM-dependent methyltransferase [Actinoplanes sp. Pm04-4]|uniref:Class I SAM-dependent methyltransferase n=1 Tax=Paractinoplanes pyxinae TaxID=2997416 RepID=A0ABT4BES2_9ACTN|nr:class I SAM-dependent methyltransferase [Actinoplanes pyxinae]MCY1144073.1 class I SAM-dependent methyltransferase [Actinoplanes pyxinae]
MGDNAQGFGVVRHAETTPLVGHATHRSMQDTFAQIYASGVWSRTHDSGRQDVSLSGPGSNLQQTAALRAELPRVIADLGIRTFLDAPCGDYYWMSRVDLGVESYLGVDVVPEMIQRNRDQFAGAGCDFRVLDVIKDEIPPVDLIFSRDCLVHFSDVDVNRALDNFKRSGAKYLATTTFVGRSENAEDIVAGGWRPLNLSAAPFSLPRPMRVIDEQCTEIYRYNEHGVKVTNEDEVREERRFEDKAIGVWRIVDL